MITINFDQDKKNKVRFAFATIMIIIVVSWAKFKSSEINYLNSDATWHTLLTIEAYDENTISVHKFLPIVSLGQENDKYISWGATIPDQNGNYYYTSFSPASYTSAYLFIKIMKIPINEQSLYVYNTFLFIISALIWGALLFKLYEKSKYQNNIIAIGILTFIFSPEVFHGMGIVYWAQSLMQVTLLIQISAYYIWKLEQSKKAKIVFFALTLVNPYIEWTGYVANIGFALAELAYNRKNDIIIALKNAILIGFLTIASFTLFTLHYLSVIAASDFFLALKNRFFARNITSTVLLTDIFAGYLRSFLLLWLLLFILTVWNIIKKGSVEFNHKILMFIMTFPILENIIMKEHALSYSYDRMKLIYLLSFLICELSLQILENAKKKKDTAIGLIVITLICCIGNLRYYINDKKYIWDVNYRYVNEEFANYINDNYKDSVLVLQAPVRGYINLLFGRGIYEGMGIDSAIEIANEKNKSYAIELQIDDNKWNMYQLTGAIVHDMRKNETFEVHAPKKFILANLTDNNWANGYSRVSNTLLFKNDELLIASLSYCSTLKCNNQAYSIVNVSYDSDWIRITVNKDASQCAFPAEITLE